MSRVDETRRDDEKTSTLARVFASFVKVVGEKKTASDADCFESAKLVVERASAAVEPGKQNAAQRVDERLCMDVFSFTLVWQVSFPAQCSWMLLFAVRSTDNTDTRFARERLRAVGV